jgi:hypothetical protein
MSSKAERELASVKRFVDAMTAVGERLQREAMDEFDQTGESGYREGDAAGYARATKLVYDFLHFDPSKVEVA